MNTRTIPYRPNTKRRQTIDGLPVYDATEPLEIEVLPVDIVPRTRQNPEACALATATCRELSPKGVDHARFHLSRAYVRQADHWLRYEVTSSTRTEMVAFDRGGTFQPGVYYFWPLTEGRRSGSPGQGGAGKHTKSQKPRDTSPKAGVMHKVEGVRPASPLSGGSIEHVTRPGIHTGNTAYTREGE